MLTNRRECWHLLVGITAVFMIWAVGMQEYAWAKPKKTKKRPPVQIAIPDDSAELQKLRSHPQVKFEEITGNQHGDKTPDTVQILKLPHAILCISETEDAYVVVSTEVICALNNQIVSRKKFDAQHRLMGKVKYDPPYDRNQAFLKEARRRIHVAMQEQEERAGNPKD